MVRKRLTTNNINTIYYSQLPTDQHNTIVAAGINTKTQLTIKPVSEVRLLHRTEKTMM